MITRRFTHAISLLIALITIMMVAPTLYAQGCEENIFDPLCDDLVVVDEWWNDDGISIDHQIIDVTIDDQIATTKLDMQFSNANLWWVESSYVFPLPANATITNLILYINGEPTSGEVLDKNEAQAIYDEYVNQFIDPALLQEVGEDVFELNVFPIEELDSRRVIVEYQEILPADTGVIDYVFPQNLAYSSKEIGLQTINVTINSNHPISDTQSDTHAIAFDISNNSLTANASYEGENVTPDRNFKVSYTIPATDDPLNMTLLSHMPDLNKDGYMAMLMNPLADYDESNVIPQDLLFIVDTSGSMGGEKISQAKDAVTKVIETLGENDRFNIISFSSGTRRYSDELVSAANPGDYPSFINSLAAAGATNIGLGFENALAQVDPERLTTVLFLSDGAATEGLTSHADILNLLEENVSDNVRLYSFGVGTADYPLLEAITENHEGSTTRIVSNDQVASAVSDFYKTISRPVLTDITIDFGDAPIEQIQPEGPYDLFVGQQLIVTGRYRPSIHEPITVNVGSTGQIETTLASSFPITLTGMFNGEQVQIVYNNQTVVNGEGNDAVPVEWAKRTANMYESIIDELGETAELTQTVTNIGIEYQIITRYTAYLVEEPLLQNMNPVPPWWDGQGTFITSSISIPNSVDVNIPTSVDVNNIDTNNSNTVIYTGLLFTVILATAVTSVRKKGS